jgi:hypothetical protein
MVPGRLNALPWMVIQCFLTVKMRTLTEILLAEELKVTADDSKARHHRFTGTRQRTRHFGVMLVGEVAAKFVRWF